MYAVKVTIQPRLLHPRLRLLVAEEEGILLLPQVYRSLGQMSTRIRSSRVNPIRHLNSSRVSALRQCQTVKAGCLRLRSARRSQKAISRATVSHARKSSRARGNSSARSARGARAEGSTASTTAMQMWPARRSMASSIRCGTRSATRLTCCSASRTRLAIRMMQNSSMCWTASIQTASSTITVSMSFSLKASRNSSRNTCMTARRQ